MTFVLLSRVLLWLLLGTIIYSLFQRFYPSGTFIGRLILGVLLVVVLLSFVNPNEPAVASLWRVISFPLKPLGASILLMIFAAQRIKGGGIDKPGGYLLGWALTILLLSSTPAVAYLLLRSPLAMVDHTTIARIETMSSGTLVALGHTPNALSDVMGDSILPQAQMSPAIALNGEMIPPYLLQTPRDIPRRGLRLEDFVPNAETLSITTRVWESYLTQAYVLLRGGSR